MASTVRLAAPGGFVRRRKLAPVVQGEAGRGGHRASTVTVELPRAARPELEVPMYALHDQFVGPGVWMVVGDRVRFRPVRVVRLGEETAAIAGDGFE